VLKTNSPYLPPAVQPEDYMPEDAAGMSQANIGLLRLEAEKARSKKVRGLKVIRDPHYVNLKRIKGGIEESPRVPGC
jgi:hypothetical protein